jgi:L-threonylcarbamoyladenylate synthase
MCFNMGMETEVLQVNPDEIEMEAVRRAAEVLRGGGLVAFPTETVYGLGANALDATAVARIFEAKGRPANNPVIVHVSDTEAAQALVTDWPESAQKLAERFWPGPLTIVLPKTADIPDIVTGGGPTVALRVPAHPIARALLQEAGVPIAAPSANRSMQLSPTRAAHVLRGLNGRIDLLLDGGPAAGGLESTVIDLTSTPPRLLRPGLITPAALESVIGPITRAQENVGTNGPLPSPGMMERHYAPRAGLETVQENGRERVEVLCRVGLKVGWLAFPSGVRLFRGSGGGLQTLMIIEMPDSPEAYASRLYAALYELDEAGVDRIIVSLPPEADDWLAVRDRLRRAATTE